jgi:hypothetical protein
MGANLAEGREASLAGARSGARRDFQAEEEARFGRGLGALGFASGLRRERRAGARDLYGLEREREQEMYEREKYPAQYGLGLLASERAGREQDWEEQQQWYENRKKRRQEMLQGYSEGAQALLPYVL